MHFLTQRRNLSASELLLGAAFIVVALSTWNHNKTFVDPDAHSTENWRYQLWQIGTLVIAFAGAAWFWSNGQSQPRVRALAMVLLVPVIFLNAYSEQIFGDHVGTAGPCGKWSMVS